MKLVLATSNRGKLEEMRPLLADLGHELVTQGELGVSDAVEDGLSFVENALIKARHAARCTGLPALADDSGIIVDALGGAPGLISARYAGTHGDSAANIRKLLDALSATPEPQRTARFFAVIVLLRHAEDPQPVIAEGTWEGRILDMPRGDGGHGYDPVFLDLASGLSAAEMPLASKNGISHRAKALAALREKLLAARWP